MKSQNLPSQLPFLPGNSYADPTITRYHKTQLLGVKDNTMCEKTTSLQEKIDSSLIDSMKNGLPLGLTGIPQRQPQENDAIPKIAPKWLKYDRQVLKFEAFFQEPVVEDPNENYRIRKCIVMYYLDDDTIHIIENRVENAGIPQGIFLKRHKLPLPNDQSQFYNWTDLNLASNLNVYGRIFRIVDCDQFTKDFYSNEGKALNAPEQFPDDPFVHTRAMINMKQTPPDQAELKNYIEVQLKGGRPNKNLKSFLENDRKVLSFNILWEDRSYDGGDKYYILNYFLSDNSIEVKEINQANTGRFPFPMLLKRQKLAKAPIMTHCPGMSLRTEEFYTPYDLLCGTNIDIYGRICSIYDCDDFTRAFYDQILGIDQKPVQLKKGRPTVMYQPLPVYNGYGTEEDSLGSVYSLNAKPPKIDMKKMFKQDMHILRFDAKLISTEPDDETRRFIISFYCGDDTIQIYEVCDKNSGRIGGKFMERKKHKNPVSDRYYEEKNFLIGQCIFLGGFKFQLLKADEYTEKYMEDNPDQFPGSSIDQIVHKIKVEAQKAESLQQYVVDLIKQLDQNNDGVINFQEFTAGLRSMNIFVTNHEENALMKRFDYNGDGKISMEEFYNFIAEKW